MPGQVSSFPASYDPIKRTMPMSSSSQVPKPQTSMGSSMSIIGG